MISKLRKAVSATLTKKLLNIQDDSNVFTACKKPPTQDYKNKPLIVEIKRKKRK